MGEWWRKKKTGAGWGGGGVGGVLKASHILCPLVKTRTLINGSWAWATVNTARCLVFFFFFFFMFLIFIIKCFQKFIAVLNLYFIAIRCLLFFMILT